MLGEQPLTGPDDLHHEQGGDRDRPDEVAHGFGPSGTGGRLWRSAGAVNCDPGPGRGSAGSPPGRGHRGNCGHCDRSGNCGHTSGGAGAGGAGSGFGAAGGGGAGDGSMVGAATGGVVGCRGAGTGALTTGAGAAGVDSTCTGGWAGGAGVIRPTSTGAGAAGFWETNHSAPAPTAASSATTNAAIGSAEPRCAEVSSVGTGFSCALEQVSWTSLSVRSRSHAGAGMNTGAAPSRAAGLASRRRCASQTSHTSM